MAIVYNMHQGGTSGLSHKSPEPAEVFVGCSGWHYKEWRNSLYPPCLPEWRWLTHYSTVVRTIEMNAAF